MKKQFEEYWKENGGKLSICDAETIARNAFYMGVNISLKKQLDFMKSPSNEKIFKLT